MRTSRTRCEWLCSACVRVAARDRCFPPKCSVCGLDYGLFDPGDGPAVFVILIVGAIVAAGALYVEFTFSPPYWVHAVIWLPTIAILTFVFLRLAKSILVVLQYKHQAQEGRRVK